MPTRDEQHDREARARFKNQARDALRTSQKAADGARKSAEDAALDLKTRKEYRRKRVDSTKGATD